MHGNLLVHFLNHCLMIHERIKRMLLLMFGVKMEQMLHEPLSHFVIRGPLSRICYTLSISQIFDWHEELCKVDLT